MVEMRQ